MKTYTIAIVGAGSVGTTLAYACMMKNIPCAIRLIDIDTVRCYGEILDLSDALTFCPSISIAQGTNKDLADADIVIVAAGQKQKPGQDRNSLLSKNKLVIKSIFERVKLKKSTIIIVVTNPVDIMTYWALIYSKLPAHQVIGSGTFLDTLRARFLLSQKLTIDETSINAFILGEHGSTQFPAWSSASIGGIPLVTFPGITKTMLATIAQKTKNKAGEIIKCKGATYFGIATCVASLCQMIIFNEQKVVPISHLIEKHDICLSLPVVLGADGIRQLNIPLSKQESASLKKSIDHLKKLTAA